MSHNRYNAAGNSEDVDCEVLRQDLINKLEAAYFCGIGPAAVEIVDIKYADKEKLLEIARQWGLI